MSPKKPPAPTRSVIIANRHPRLRLDRRALVAMIHALDRHHARIRVPRPAFLRAELSLVFLSDPALARIHARFLDDPTVTDVITFEGDEAHGTAGEICVSADAAERRTGSPSGKAAGPGFNAELALYIVHGWLHLAGYNDVNPAKKRAMRRAEARAMAVLRRAKSLPRFRLAAR